MIYADDLAETMTMTITASLLVAGLCCDIALHTIDVGEVVYLVS